MVKKILIWILSILTLVLIVYGCTNDQPSPSCSKYTLDDEHKIVNTSEQPKGDWNSMKSPEGSLLQQIVIDPDDPNIIDESWRYAYYSISDNIFWIADMPGKYFAGWYGPYTGYPCLR